MGNDIKLMIPGPTEVSDEVCRKLSLPMQPHYGDEWSKLYYEVVDKLKKIFQTKEDLFVVAATSSSVMEMAVSHAAEPGEKILICNNGFFGDRFTEMAECVGLNVITTRSAYGQPITAKQIRESLDKNPDIRAIAVVHNESSTAVETELSEIMDEVRKRGIISIVDVVSSMGAVDIPTDKLGIDFCVSGSQKGFAAPAGLGFISVSKNAWDKIKSRKQPVRSWYLNLNILNSYKQKWVNWHPQGPNTAPVSLYMALNQALDEILAEGLANRFERHIRARNAFRSAMRVMGLELFVEDAIASKTLTAIRLPEGIDGTVLRKNILDKHKILITGGIGETANTVIRVGHLAWTASEKYLVPTIEAIEKELVMLKAKVKEGVAVKEFPKKFSL